MKFYVQPSRMSNPTIVASKKLVRISIAKSRPKMSEEGKRLLNCLMLIMYPPTYASQGEYQLHIFEDNEAVIKMIYEGRSPTMTHVSRTHRGALDWLLDMINLETKIQIKYVDTRNQLAYILTKGTSRNEWNQLLRLFNIDFSMFSCSFSDDFLSDDQVGKHCAMSKRGQEATSNEGSPMVKARPCLVARDSRSEVISSGSLGSLVNLGECDERKEVEIPSGKKFASRFKIRSRVLSSESTRECSNGRWEELAGGATPDTP